MSEENQAVLFIIVFFFIGMLIGGGCTKQSGDNSWRDQISDHGCAEYYLDQNHERQWRWK